MMDTAVVPGTLYYIAGYHHGSNKAAGTSGAAAPDSGSNAGASDAAATGTDSASSDTAGETAAGSEGEQAEVARISGFYEIPVEDVLTACAETPDRKVSDVVTEKRDSAKSGTQ